MKISKKSFEYLKQEIDAVLEKYGSDELVAQYENGEFARADSVKCLQRRFCFDLLFAAGLNKFVSDLYRDENLNDDHIFTALKKIAPKVTKKY